jgi:hypothetical protein
VFRPEVIDPAPQHGHAPPDHAESRALLQIAIEHAQLYEASFGHRSRYYFLPMRKHLSWYVRGLPSASHLRRELVHVESLAQATAILQHYLTHWRVAPATGAAMKGLAGGAGVDGATAGTAAESRRPDAAHTLYDALRQSEGTANLQIAPAASGA